MSRPRLPDLSREEVFTVIRYKKNLIEELKAAGYNTTRIRKERILSESTLQAFREGALVSWSNIDRVCALLGCQPGDILEYRPGTAESSSGEA